MAGILSTLGQGQGFLKAGFLGFQKSGKTYTAVKLAIGTRAFFGLKGPIAFVDTEGGSEYVAAMVKRETGVDLLGIRSRSFDDLMKVANECDGAEISVLLVDSVTHVWRELCDAFLEQLNERLTAANRTRRRRLEFQDWAEVKGIWQRWTNFYLNSELHVIICGRAGYEYDMEENEEGRKELVKTGIKMKVEGEFGFEPSLLVEMEREQVPNGKGGFTLKRKATVLGDRFGVIDGAESYDPTFDFFKPHISMLKAGAHAPVDTRVKTDAGVDLEGDAEWHRERKTRVIVCEEIAGALVKYNLAGQGGDEKKRRLDLLEEVFATRSWTAIEGMDSGRLRAGLAKIREKFEPKPAPAAAGAPVGEAEKELFDGPADQATRKGLITAIADELAKWESPTMTEERRVKLFATISTSDGDLTKLDEAMLADMLEIFRGYTSKKSAAVKQVRAALGLKA